MPRLRLPASRQQPCHTTFARDRHVPCRRQRLAQPSPTRNPLDCAGWLVLSQCLASLGRVGAPRLSLQAINCRSVDLSIRREHTITFRKDGYKDKSYQVSRSVGFGWIVLDVLGGLVGIIVDAATGDWFMLDTDHVNVIMAPAS